MKKILIYIDSVAPSAGIERVVSNMANYLIDYFDITILTKDGEESFYFINDKVKFISLDIPLNIKYNDRIRRGLNFFKSICLCHLKLKNIMKKEKPEYIYTTNLINSFEIKLLGKNYMRKLTISEHGSSFAYNKFYKILKKYIYPKAFKIIVPTKTDTKIYSELKYPAEYIPHFSTFNEIIEKEKIESKIVLNVGRLTSDKQQLKLLEIWKNTLKKIDDFEWKLQIIGKGEEEENLKKYVEKNKLHENVEFIKPTKNINEYFKKASIFAFTSKYEGFGMVLLEAMSFGLPCISFDCDSGPRDIINSFENGFLIKKFDIKEFEFRLIELIKDNKLRKKMSGKAFESILNWNNEKILNQWIKLYGGEK